MSRSSGCIRTAYEATRRRSWTRRRAASKLRVVASDPVPRKDPTMADTITREELRSAIDAGSVVVVETLGPMYFNLGHLPGAINIPHTQVDELAASLLPDKD